MNYSAQDRWGDTIETPDEREMDRLLESLTIDNGDRAEVSLTHESGWSLTVYDGGLVVWANVDEGASPVHMANLSRQQVLSLWHDLARGHTEALFSHAWEDGDQPE